MEQPKHYWCFSCNKECPINKSIIDGEETLICSLCKNDFVEEMETKEPTSTTVNQPSANQQSTNNNQIPQFNNITVDDNGINIELSLNDFNLNNSTINNMNPPSNNQQQQQQQQPQDQYGMDNTLLFLPSTVNYVVQNPRNLGQSIFGLASSFLGPTINSIFGGSSNNTLMNFLNNHNNDTQFENLIGIIMSLENRMHGNPPASERAMNNLKKVDVTDDNINEFKEITCNICLDTFKVGNIIRILECKHEFHEDCIIRWLKSRNTCPVCRFELESNDPNYERQKNNHRTNLRNFHRGDGGVQNNNNRGGGPGGMFA